MTDFGATIASRGQSLTLRGRHPNITSESPKTILRKNYFLIIKLYSQLVHNAAQISAFQGQSSYNTCFLRNLKKYWWILINSDDAINFIITKIDNYQIHYRPCLNLQCIKRPSNFFHLQPSHNKTRLQNQKPHARHCLPKVLTIHYSTIRPLCEADMLFNNIYGNSLSDYVWYMDFALIQLTKCAKTIRKSALYFY